MDGILWAVGAGTAAVLGVALAVSVWEHLRPAERRAPAPPDTVPAPPPVVAVDIDLDMPASDAERRRGILDDALWRMTQPAPLSEGGAPTWTETAPMVGPQTEPPRPR